jgi:hypothetical protein
MVAEAIIMIGVGVIVPVIIGIPTTIAMAIIIVFLLFFLLLPRLLALRVRFLFSINATELFPKFSRFSGFLRR